MLCSKPNGLNCKENYSYEYCEQPNDTKVRNYDCKYTLGYKSDYFDCTNRMDKRKIMFDKPPISVKKGVESTNYNTALIHDENSIYCGKFNFTYEDFFQIRLDHGMEYCTLADGKRVTFEELWSNLLTDFSFNMTKKMDEL